MDENKLIRLIDEGLTVPAISEELTVSISSVWRRLKKLSLKTKRAWTHDANAKEKRCVRCEKTKPIAQFYLAGGKSDGNKYRRRYCSDCYDVTKQVRRKEMRVWFEEYKKTLKCKSCNDSDFRVLEFHHKDKSDKDGDVSSSVSSARWSKVKIMKEVKKCSVLCANCHRKIHYEERNGM